MTIYLSALACLAGSLVYGFSGNSKAAELGKIAFAMGLLAFLLQVTKMVSLP